MKICFICETPYQIFNAINYAVNQKEYKEIEIDLYVGILYEDAVLIADRLRKQNLLNNIFLYKYKNENFALRLLFVAFPFLYLKHTTKKYNTIAENLNYDRIFISTYSSFGMAMIMFNKRAEVCLYDDGLGTYIGKIGFNTITKNRRRVYKFMGMNYKHLFPKFIYINNHYALRSEWNAEIKQFPSLLHLNSKFKAILQSVFKAPIDEYRKIKIVWLSQPHFITNKESVDTDELFYNVLKKYEFVIRPHPLEKSNKNIGENCIIDNSGSLWELVCAEAIDDDSILIGMCSTAQASPKLLFNKEPYILFTYLLYKDIPESNRKIYHQLFENIQQLYRDPKKVIEIENEQQLECKLKEILLN